MAKQAHNVVKVDSKRRLALPKGVSVADYYAVVEESNGDITLKPRIVADPREVISRLTLAAIDESMENFENGKVGKPIDLSKFTSTVKTSNGKKRKKT